MKNLFYFWAGQSQSNFLVGLADLNVFYRCADVAPSRGLQQGDAFDYYQKGFLSLFDHFRILICINYWHVVHFPFLKIICVQTEIQNLSRKRLTCQNMRGRFFFNFVAFSGKLNFLTSDYFLVFNSYSNAKVTQYIDSDSNKMLCSGLKTTTAWMGIPYRFKISIHWNTRKSLIS